MFVQAARPASSVPMWKGGAILQFFSHKRDNGGSVYVRKERLGGVDRRAVRRERSETRPPRSQQYLYVALSHLEHAAMFRNAVRRVAAPLALRAAAAPAKAAVPRATSGTNESEREG